MLVLLVLSTNRFDNIPGLVIRENGSSALAGRISRNTTFPVFMYKATTGNTCQVFVSYNRLHIGHCGRVNRSRYLKGMYCLHLEGF
jgi:hypothetical protein